MCKILIELDWTQTEPGESDLIVPNSYKQARLDLFGAKHARSV